MPLKRHGREQNTSKEVKEADARRLEALGARITTVETALNYTLIQLEGVKESLKNLSLIVDGLDQKLTPYNHTIQVLQEDVDLLKEHWERQFFQELLYNPLTYIGLAATASGVHFEGEDKQLSKRTLACYGTGVLLFNQLMWDMLEPNIPEGIKKIADIGVLATVAGLIYHAHLYQGTLNPYLTKSNLVAFSTVAAALTQYQSIISFFPVLKNSQ